MAATSYKAVIVLNLPDGINFYCGKVIYQGQHLDHWNTEIEQAIVYFNKTIAKKRLSILRTSKGQSHAKLKDFNRLPKATQEQRNNFLFIIKKQNNGNTDSSKTERSKQEQRQLNGSKNS